MSLSAVTVTYRASGSFQPNKTPFEAPKNVCLLGSLSSAPPSRSNSTRSSRSNASTPGLAGRGNLLVVYFFFEVVHLDARTLGYAVH